ncbi:hypothetical protein EVAR_63733_1 [Eumeta japonica]|uniref:Retrovirus-related Pol polyprotein from transposon opus n=1 Tax=Eumeta variegata TaxID=151549 RepID=A0A4C1ZG09_EUMVA|nr:hypothetical protein EVAR_63733_1 [Eumeta japonica]
MERLQFEVELAADEDPKNNIIIIKSITKRMERHISYRQVFKQPASREILLKRPYRCSLDDKKEIEKQIEQLLKNELIEESYSPFAAPVTLAFKRDEGKKSRLCIDFRDLNKIIIPQPQPFPLIEDLLEHLKHLSKLLDAIAEEGFRLKLTKCKFAAQSVRFLGHIVEGNTITPLKDNLRSIAEFPAPQNKKQIRQFLDHKPLENLNIKNRTDDELGDMTHYLSQYNFVIKYNPGPAEKPFQIMSIDTVGGFGGNRSSKSRYFDGARGIERKKTPERRVNLIIGRHRRPGERCAGDKNAPPLRHSVLRSGQNKLFIHPATARCYVTASRIILKRMGGRDATLTN